MAIGDDLSDSHLRFCKHMSSDYRKALPLRSEMFPRVFIIPEWRESKESTKESLNSRKVLSLYLKIFSRAFIISRKENAREIHSRALYG